MVFISEFFSYNNKDFYTIYDTENQEIEVSDEGIAWPADK